MRRNTRPLLLASLLAAAPAWAEPPKTMQLDLGKGVKMDLVAIPAGEFAMGAPEAEKERQPYETPVHKVKITRPFHLGRCEVTNAQYRAFRPGHHSRHLDGDDQPVLFVSWHDADAFCRWLSAKARKNVRLPTEAEWEYACRAGTTTRFYTGDRIRGVQSSVDLSKAGWSGGTARGRSKPVGQLAANAFGLYDMHGNAWEWCADWFGEAYYGQSPPADPTGPKTGRARVLRGGGYFHWQPAYFRSAARYSLRPEAREPVTGFRVAVEAGPYKPRPPARVVQPWPVPRRIAPRYVPANDKERRAAAAFGPPAVFVPKAAAPKIDGKLDDAVWKRARPLHFRFLSGRAAPPEAPTVARVLCGQTHLYFAFDCTDGDMSRLTVAGKNRDDPVWQGDTVEVFLDPLHAAKAAEVYHIAVNPAGVTMDTKGGDPMWAPELKVATTRAADRWTVELAVPYVSLELRRGELPTVWGLNLTRYRPDIAAGKPRRGTLVPHSWPVDRPDLLRQAEDTGWAPTFSDSSHWPSHFGHAVVEAGTKPANPPKPLFRLIAREDFSGGTRGRFSKGDVVDGGYMGAGKALRVRAADGATLFAVPLKSFRDVQLLATVKAVGGSGMYWHTFGKMYGNDKCCPRQVTTLTRDFPTLAPSFNYCDGAGRIDWTSKGMADPYYAGFHKHLSWFSEPTIGRVCFGGPKHWAVAYTRVGDLQTQHPSNKRVDGDKDRIGGWFFHPAGKNEILLSDVVLFEGIDNVPPARPAGVKVQVRAGKAVVSWKPADDNTLTVWYQLTAGGKTVAEVAELSAVLPAAKVKGRALTVRAVDFFENFSEPSEAVKVE